MEKKIKLIKLTAAPISKPGHYYVNPEHITHIHAGSDKSPVSLYLIGSPLIFVRETIGEIQGLINER